MATRSRIADALLGSPIPAPNWQNPRFSKRGWSPPRSGRPGLRGGTRRMVSQSVPAAEVRARLDEINSTINPPIVAGWAWCLAIVGALVELGGLLAAGRSHASDLGADLAVVVPVPAWIAIVGLAALRSRQIELRDNSIFVNDWLRAWAGTTGRRIGRRSHVRAELGRGRIQLSGDEASVSISLATWPSSSLRWLEDRFEAWGIPLERE